MEFVILGQKKVVKGQTSYRIFHNEKYRPAQAKIVKLGEKVKAMVSPFPFDTFSSLDNDDPSFKEYQACYLLIDTNIPSDKQLKMVSSSISSHEFYNQEITVLEEFNKPLQYALETYLKHPKRLGTWDLTTWLIHERIRSNEEFEAMSKILKLAYKNYVNSEYYLSISFDKSVIPYLPQLVDLPKVKFGDGGYFDKSVDTMLQIDNLTADQFSRFIFEYIYDISTLIEICIKSPILGEEWFFNELQNKASLLVKALKNNVFEKETFLNSLVFDKQRFFDVWYDKMVSQKYQNVNAFFNSKKIEKKYLEAEKKYQAYEEELAVSDDEYDRDYKDYGDDYLYDDDDDDYYTEMPPTPTDRRLDVLRYFDNLFGSLIPDDIFKAKFSDVPDVLWERLYA